MIAFTTASLWSWVWFSFRAKLEAALTFILKITAQNWRRQKLNQLITAFNYRNMRFTTVDEDNDLHAQLNCAEAHGGGWWYNACDHANPNGPFQTNRYLQNLQMQNDYGMEWDAWIPNYSFSGFIMRIKPTYDDELLWLSMFITLLIRLLSIIYQIIVILATSIQSSSQKKSSLNHWEFRNLVGIYITVYTVKTQQLNMWLS